jgi:HD-GYP domain-containing protein (c-di-GMP phosphodiesterase class II)
VQHHERMDGSGYPGHLRGDEILMGARIIAVADTVEAMAAHRPYRASLGLDEALAAVEEGRGVIFDATVVDSCLALFKDGPLTADLLRLLKGEQPDLPLPAGATLVHP